MNITASGLSHVGMQRSENQDSYLMNEKEHIYVVADGMGGHAGGEIASQMCVASFTEKTSTPLPLLNTDSEYQIFLERILNEACTKIYEMALENPELKGMGTTASCVMVKDNQIHCAHVGDSRIYLIRAGFIYQLSIDHSLVSEQFRAGLITEDMIETHQLKNVITRSIGYQEEEFVDTFTREIEPGDMLVLCSDGLHGKIADQEIVNICAEADATKHLIELANERGGEDNITVILIKIGSND